MKKNNEGDNAGSLAYNRLDFQISQAMLLAVEWESFEDFTIVMDFYEDVAIFEGAQGKISMFQIKTNEESFSFSHILRQKWFKKLCNHMVTYAHRVKELSLITNCPIKLVNNEIRKDKKTYVTKVLSGDSLQALLENVGNKGAFSKEQLDNVLTHRKTPLGIDNHDKVAEKIFADYLQGRYSSIEIRLANAISATVRDLLSTAQKKENVSTDTAEDLVLQQKGVTKGMINRVIEGAAYVEPLDYDDVEKYAPAAIIEKLRLPYIELLNDRKKNRGAYKNIYYPLKEVVINESFLPGETMWQFCCRCADKCTCNNEQMRVYAHVSPEYYLELLALNIHIVHYKL